MTKQINKNLSAEQKEVLFKHGTEAPFSGRYYKKGEDGVYHCVNCDNPLFKTEQQFYSECGWPSFVKPVGKNSVKYITDESFGMIRTEVVCGKCGAHLGHVFDDGPGPTHQRYCINSVVLDLKKGGK